MLSTVIIARDEARRLPAAIASVGGLGEVLVCDTGSRDRTIDAALELGATVTETQWHDDFSAARATAQLSARFEWIMRMDADETLVVTRGSAEDWVAAAISRAERVDADRIYVLRQYSAANCHWFPRLFRASRYRWVQPLHEMIVAVGERRRTIAATGACFVHRRSARPRGYADMAARHLALRPSSAHLRYYLARGLWEEERQAESIAILRDYLRGPVDYRFHRAEAHRMLGVALAEAEPDESIRHLMEASRMDSGRAEAAADLVRLLLRRGESVEARRWIEFGSDLVAPTESAPWGGQAYPYLLEAPAWGSRLWRELWRRSL